MKIPRESWLKATAKAMQTDSAQELFKSDSEIETLFTNYSFHLYTKLKGKTLTESEFNETIADIHIELLSELGADPLNIIVNMVLIIFAVQIWENLTEQSAQDEFTPDYENFKSALKSQQKSD